MCALETGYMLCGHGICSMDMSSCWRRIYGYGRCLLVGEEYMAMKDVFLLEKKIWVWKMFFLEEYMDTEDVFLEKNIWIWKMSSCWRRIYALFI